MRRIIVVVVLVALVVAAAPDAWADQELGSLVNSGYQAADDSLYCLAAWYYGQAYYFSGNVGYLRACAQCFQMSGWFKEAICLFKQAIDEDTVIVGDYHRLGDCYYEEQFSPDSALKYYSLAYDISCNSRDSVDCNRLYYEAYQIAEIYFNADLYDSAEVWAKIAHQHIPTGYSKLLLTMVNSKSLLPGYNRYNRFWLLWGAANSIEVIMEKQKTAVDEEFLEFCGYTAMKLRKEFYCQSLAVVVLALILAVATASIRKKLKKK